MDGSVPPFARLEIRLDSRNPAAIATDLRRLAIKLDHIAKTAEGDRTAAILAYHAIRETSQKLRA